MKPTVAGSANGEGWWKRREGAVILRAKACNGQARATNVKKRKGAKHGGSDGGPDDGSEEVSNKADSDPKKAMEASMPRTNDDEFDDEGTTNNPAEGLFSRFRIPANAQKNQDERSDDRYGDNIDRDDIGFSLAESSDADDLFDLNVEVPDWI
ncbi:hypothetical protein B0F90DRAFT_1820779 [Multifurca ochricompacta]|uniref:Uncharacterized protein n=1 Tax=Multifurca ochricompacta TaxID=376703 RepID=A0AAD4QKV7_9AGAM|nr:hypothetical protein B0F90DRAFT_1820779 [Multifurca ochricompacta]